MKKVVLTMALVAMMSVSCKDQAAATEETAVEAVDTAAVEAVDTAAAAVDTAAAAAVDTAAAVKEEVKK
ncbi:MULTISPECIES: hypothetical protein [Flavobacterium]|uniref:Lipoprotein n=1 Tax=Flavobacterium columnare TaxID=996 RepID=A0AA94JQD0_9FLAO|nr:MULTISPECIES: hypothetical protein [Flavobacterium]AMA48338.1 hypothetical protein AWN65_02065 [Flavobacterium covae]AND63500.1 hypothetical protein AX766_03300 [Flavobacterium covae]MCH4830264.1 hypothetical protein [Flavobacterium columnare]MCH4832353.1 hypothetical protein [Flavobacterium columnare]MCJ1808435.1 hypothetical protein [Flavobacterium covae]